MLWLFLRWTEKNAKFKIAVSGLEVKIYEVSWMPQEVVSGEASRWWYVLLLRVSGVISAVIMLVLTTYSVLCTAEIWTAV